MKYLIKYITSPVNNDWNSSTNLKYIYQDDNTLFGSDLMPFTLGAPTGVRPLLATLVSSAEGSVRRDSANTHAHK